MNVTVNWLEIGDCPYFPSSGAQDFAVVTNMYRYESPMPLPAEVHGEKWV